MANVQDKGDSSIQQSSGGGKAERSPRKQLQEPSSSNNNVNNNARFPDSQQVPRPRPPRRGMFSIPDRWEDYKAIGRPISNTRIIAFKTPLKDEFLRNKPGIEQFNVESLVQQMKSRNYNLGLVIDLTATTKYYDPEDLKRHGIEYKKVFCPGRDFSGLEERGTLFMETVRDFFEENHDNDKLVGVHCLHGLNRTGYLVCRYMHELLGWPVDVAIEYFNEARGHEMERKEYMNALRFSCQLHLEENKC